MGNENKLNPLQCHFRYIYVLYYIKTVKKKTNCTNTAVASFGPQQGGVRAVRTSMELLFEGP